MKVRILSNSLRFRLKEPEVMHFRESGKVVETLEFGPLANEQLCFTLEMSSNPDLVIDYQQNAITIYVPKMLAEEWVSTDLVGFDGKYDTGKGKQIDVLVEKDFMCLDSRREKNIGSYPNPLMHPGL